MAMERVEPGEALEESVVEESVEEELVWEELVWEVGLEEMALGSEVLEWARFLC